MVLSKDEVPKIKDYGCGFVKNVLTEKIIIKDIPLLLLKEKGSSSSKGVIFLYHGWSSKKENYHFIGSIFALDGYQVVIPDSQNHGERGALDYDDEKVMEDYFWKTAINSVDEYFFIKEYLEENKLLLTDKFFITGSSMGGMISAGIFVKDHNISSLAVMNGACNWLDLDERVKKSRNLDRSRGIENGILEEYNPAAVLDNFGKRAVLIQHGEDDSSVPIETQDTFFKNLLEHYKGYENRLRYTRIPGLNHHKTTGMIEELVYWFNSI